MREIQRQVDQMIIHLGGYWRPLSGLARLLEEVGEVGGALHDDDNTALVEELLDVFVISTCLANQYAITLHSPTSDADDAPIHVTYFALAREAGEVARILNAYEGDKKLKATATPGSLQRHIEGVQRAVVKMAERVGLDVYESIGALVEEKSSRDFGRFDHTPDPITEPSVRSFSRHVTGRYWGGIEPKPFETFDRYKEREHHLTRFFKVAPVEGLDGFVIRLRDQNWTLTDETLKLAPGFYITEEIYGNDKYMVIRQLN
ncbi:MazG nucleotide pyrophosphohydrolase domain [Exiguobacterium aurantiacum]|uniref:MazG nucleotide pyrophosphohydrolase domain n=2 Tax=Bacillales Family XII. Incertae Sedis TaxID=539742 RepID=A0A377FS55_9BACL|nr:MazG nucleotide pyrophosphohydrolase domain-containing protein [Exiguobacterium sp. ZOR0005]STO07652.1 MazG nucleotide pyrophosphohydrolase domain [Exiguobacterium aurantiacum]